MAWTNPRLWVASEVTTAAIHNTHIRDNLLEIGDHGTWTDWTPAVDAAGGGFTLGAGSSSLGRYIVTGEIGRAVFYISVGGAGFANGSGIYRVQVPTGAISASMPTDAFIGTAEAGDNAPGNHFGMVVRRVSSALVGFYYDGMTNSGAVSDTSPFTWAQNDWLMGQFWWETT